MKASNAIKKILKSLLRFPADALLASSKTLPQRIEANSVSPTFLTRVNHAILGSPNLAAKFFPYEGGHASYLVPKVNREDQMRGADLPIPPPELRIHTYLASEQHLTKGKEDVDRMMSILEASSVSVELGNRVLDFGCGDGMMLRHFQDIAESGEAWGVEVNGALMTWCQQHLSPPFKFATTTSFPHLPFEDGYFDLIYAFSVFTHISDLAEAWLLELKRITRPGGSLYLTIHDNHTIDLLLNKYPEHGLSQQLRASEKEIPFKDSDFALFTLNRMPGGGIEQEPRMAQVYYDIDYLRQHWGNYLNVVSVTQEAYGYQTAIVLQKPKST